MRSRAIKSWYRKAVVAASILVLVVIVRGRAAHASPERGTAPRPACSRMARHRRRHRGADRRRRRRRSCVSATRRRAASASPSATRKSRPVDDRGLVECRLRQLRDADGRPAGLALLLRLRRRLRPGRRLGRQGVDVHPRQDVHDQGDRGLRRARLRADRLLRGRYRRAEELDRPADRTRRDGNRAADEAVAQGQDPRHPRSRILRQGDDQEPVRGRRRRLPHQHEPHRPRRDCARWSAIIREVEAECGRPIGILVDLQGPKLRIGTFAEQRDHAEARPDLHPRFRSQRPATPRASNCRIRKSSRRSSPATGCSSTTARCASA